MPSVIHRLLILPNLHVGGAEKVLMQLAHQGGIEEVWVVGEGLDLLPLPSGVGFRHFAARSVTQALPKLILALRRSPPDLIVTSHTHLFLALMGSRLLLPSSIRWLHREASFPSLNLLDEKHPRLFRWAAKLMLKRADGVIALAASPGEDLKENFGVPQQRIHLLPNPAIPPKTQQPTPFPPESPGPHVICLGRLHPVKRIHLVSEAFEKWKEEEPTLELWIVGDGPQKEALQEQAARGRCSESIHFMGGTPNPGPWLSHADLLVISSSHEGNSNVLLEAIAHGCPVQVLQHPGGSLDILKDANLEHRWCQSLIPRLKKEGVEGDGASRLREKRSIQEHFHRFNALTQSLAKTRELHLITSLDAGGTERQLIRTLEERNPASLSVICLSGRGLLSSELEALGIPLLHLDLKRKPVRGVLSFLRHLKEDRPRTLKCWLVHTFPLGLIAKALSPSRHLTWMVRTHSINATLIGRSTSLLTKCMALLSPAANAITYNSRKAQKEHESNGFSPRKARLIPNRFPIFTLEQISEFKASPPPELEPLLDLPGKKVGFVSRFHPQKDPPTFAKTASLLLQTHPDLHFICLGHGLEPQNSPWIDLLQKHEILEQVISYGPRDDIHRWMIHFDLLMLSSCDESFPNVIGEAMALGVPTASTKVGDLELLIPYPELLSPPGEEHLLAKAVEFGLNLETIDPKMKENLKAAVKNFSEE